MTRSFLPWNPSTPESLADERRVYHAKLCALLAPSLADVTPIDDDRDAATVARDLSASLKASPQRHTATAHDYYTEQPLGPASEELDALAFGKGGGYEILASCVDGVWVPVQGQADQWRRLGAKVRRVFVTNGGAS